jgi:hypothetical protein
MNKGRLSSVQRETLFVLQLLRQRGKAGPIPSVDILAIINKRRDNKIAPTNFRASCHTLVERQLLLKYRSDSLQLAFALSDAGKTVAELVYEERMRDINVEQ